MVIGSIARPVGVRGDVKAVSTAGHPQRLVDLESVIVGRDNEWSRLTVQAAKLSGKWVKIKFESIDSPEQASRLSGAEIVIPSAERMTLSADEYYVDELIGCSVVSDTGTELGFLVEVMHQAHHDIWVVDGPLGEILFPAVSEHIVSTDVEAHRIEVRYYEGLWDE